MAPLDKYQRIRLGNTLLACMGALILSLVVIYAVFRGYTLVSNGAIFLCLGLFWAINLTFVLCIAFGFNLHFADPSLSLPQMLWAMTASFYTLTLITELHYLIYLLVFTIAAYGTFQLNKKQYLAFCGIGIAGLAITLLYLWVRVDHRGGTNQYAGDYIVTWLVFAFCLGSVSLLFSGLSALRSKLKQRNEELSQALQVKDQFLANMSHEIRTPLNGVIGMIEVLLLRGQLNEEQKNYAEVAKSSASALLNVLNDILDISKVSSGKLTVETVPFDPGEEISEAALVYGGLAAKKDIELICDIAPDLPSLVEGDPNRFRQILNNLLSNAIKFTEQGEIVLSAKLDSIEDDYAKVSVSVSDTGIGIPFQVQENLFTEFMQGDASTTRLHGGTGLGLAICKQLCELFGGDIKVTSAPGEGSCFTFSLWLKTEKTQPAKYCDLELLRGRRVLIVDDVQTNRLVLRKLLEHLHMQVVEADSGASALPLLADQSSSKFDIAIVDMCMPELDGRALIRAIRTERNDSSLRIIVLSSVDSDNVLFEGLDVEAVLMKPLLPKSLYRSLQRLLTSTDNLAKSQETVQHRQHHSYSRGLKGLRVLLADDNEVNREVGRIILEEFGCLVELADNGNEALSKLRCANTEPLFAAVLMDCQMPFMDGYQATEAIRRGEAGEQYRGVVIIAMTAHALMGHREKCLDIGMNEHITKPLDTEVVYQTLNRWIGDQGMIESPATAPSQSENDLVWDEQAFCKRLNNKPERMEMLIGIFQQDFSNRINTLVQALQKNDIEEIVQVSHSLKGSCANMSANAFYKLMTETEKKAKNNENFDQCESLIEEVYRHEKNLSQSLNDFVQRFH